MMHQTSTGDTASARLDSLRRRLTLALGVLAASGLAVLALTATIVDSGLREDRFAEEQQGLAARAAALVFLDEDERWNVEGVIDDMVAVEAELLVVIDRFDGQIFYQQGGSADITDIADRAFADGAEMGVTGTLTVDGETYAAAAAPYFVGDQVQGAVIVASPPKPDGDHRRLVAFVWTTAGLLTALSLGGAWLIAGRVLKPMGEAIDRESQFMTTAAHELRTPLARSQALAEATLLTARGLPDSAERQNLMADLRRLVSQTKEGSAAVSDLLLVGRMDAGQLHRRTERFRLDEVVASFEGSVPELAVETTGPVHIDADPTLVRHAIANVLMNAQRHARVEGDHLLIEARVSARNGQAVVIISDNGSGVSESEQSRLFDRHYSGGQSSGLGLWIVQRILEDAAGSIAFAPNTPRGATFELRWNESPKANDRA